MPSKKKWLSPKENSLVWSTVCVICSNLLRKQASVYKLHHGSPKLRLDLQNQKKNFLFIFEKISMNIQIDKFVYRSDLKTTISVFFQQKFELRDNQFKLTEIINLNHRETHHLYKNRCYVANKCEKIESNYDV